MDLVDADGRLRPLSLLKVETEQLFNDLRRSRFLKGAAGLAIELARLRSSNLDMEEVAVSFDLIVEAAEPTLAAAVDVKGILDLAIE